MPGGDGCGCCRNGGRCNYCRALLLWLTTAAAKRMPVNHDPDPERGNVVVIRGVAGVLGPGPARGARAAGQQLYLHHAATCPHADQWRTTGTPAAAGHGKRPPPTRRTP